ncbi:hypothetical protein [Nostoc sp. GT001]|uniref:hypothetical protein n=1 Tax=Nostoc sp. GT001 TaxID=3056647 RepID=UPI0025AB38FE|nr:hypothetical protein [Nostoc sp. GT001]MDM9583154.1 hypothetical protein [Nostoc sp. GT001]
MKFISSFIVLTISTATFAPTALAQPAFGIAFSPIKDPTRLIRLALQVPRPSVAAQTPSSPSSDGEDVPYKGGGRR